MPQQGWNGARNIFCNSVIALRQLPFNPIDGYLFFRAFAVSFRFLYFLVKLKTPPFVFYSFCFKNVFIIINFQRTMYRRIRNKGREVATALLVAVMLRTNTVDG